MGLYERLCHTEEPGINNHAFFGALAEYERERWTKAQIVSAFALDAGAATELDGLLAKLVPLVESWALGGFTTLTNIGAAYDTTPASAGLGFLQLEGAGITSFVFRIGTNRSGAAGTVSWQLWNQTDSQEIAVIDDAAGAGNKFLTSGVVILGNPLSAGVRLLRVRAKSTTAADDPVYLGANLSVRRAAMLASQVFQEVIFLGEGETYLTVAQVKARLGV